MVLLESDQLKASQQVFSSLDLQETKGKYKDDVLAEDKAKRGLLQVGEKFEKLDRLRSKSYFARPWMKPTREELFSKWIDLEDHLHDEDNNKVEYKDFQVLEQALKTTLWGKTPDYLQPITLRIEKARGKATNVSHIPVQVLVCAAIKEMEDLSVEFLDWDTLKKWAATLNCAKKYGFEVGFADDLLKKNLFAYFSIQNLPDSTAKK